MEITLCHAHGFWTTQEIFKKGAKRWKMTSATGGFQPAALRLMWVGKASGEWQSSVNYLNDCKSAEHKKKTMLGRLSPKIWPWGKSAQKDYWIMIRRSAACCYVRISSSVFKLNKTCFVESSLGMRHGLFLSTAWKPSVKAISGSLRHRWDRKKQDSQS